MGNDVINIGTAVVSDILSLFGIPTNTANAILQTVMNKRIKTLREILIEEMKEGNFDNVYKDELIPIIHRTIRAAQEGTARLNLRLLAKVIKNQAINSCLKADEFLYYADLISSLKREEIILLGAYYKIQKENNKNDPWKYAKKELIPNIIKDENDLTSISQAITRTGIFITRPFADYSNSGGFVLTNFGKKVCEMAEFEKVIEQEALL